MSRVGVFLFLLVLVPGVCTAIIDDPDLINMRGDANNDQSVNHSDIVFLSNYLYSGGNAPPCMNQADVNDSGSVSGSDVIYLGNWLYSGGPPPPAPGPYNPYCSSDTTTPNPGCKNYVCP